MSTESTISDYIQALNETDRNVALAGALERLVELEEVGFEVSEEDDSITARWLECGENICIPF